MEHKEVKPHAYLDELWDEYRIKNNSGYMNSMFRSSFTKAIQAYDKALRAAMVKKLNNMTDAIPVDDWNHAGHWIMDAEEIMLHTPIEEKP